MAQTIMIKCRGAQILRARPHGQLNLCSGA